MIFHKDVLEKYEVLLLEGEVTLNDRLVYIMQATLYVTSNQTFKFEGPGTFTHKDRPDNPNDIFIPSGFGMKNIGVADYRKVEESTYCYMEGDVAHIKNIMAREYKTSNTITILSDLC